MLACLLGTFVTGSVILAAQEKSLDSQLAGALSSGVDIAPKEEISPRKIPKIEKSPVIPKTGGHKDMKSLPSNGQLVSLSHASAKKLEELPGIGPRLAEEIVRYRQTKPFRRVEDLANVPGIGPKRLEKIKDRVKVD